MYTTLLKDIWIVEKAAVLVTVGWAGMAQWAWLVGSFGKNMLIEMTLVGGAILLNNATGARRRGKLSGFASTDPSSH